MGWEMGWFEEQDGETQRKLDYLAGKYTAAGSRTNKGAFKRLVFGLVQPDLEYRPTFCFDKTAEQVEELTTLADAFDEARRAENAPISYRCHYR